MEEKGGGWPKNQIGREGVAGSRMVVAKANAVWEKSGLEGLLLQGEILWGIDQYLGGLLHW